jgi:hypothetical protein
MDNSEVKAAADRLRRAALFSGAEPCSLIAPKEAQIAGRVSSTAPMISGKSCVYRREGFLKDRFQQVTLRVGHRSGRKANRRY